MTEIRTQIEIAASSETVWQTLTDFAAYPEWNPFLLRVETELAPNAPVAMTVRVGSFTLDLDARVLSMSPGRQLRWIGPISSVKALIFSGEHYFLIQEITDDRVRFVHGEEFGGMLAPLLGWWLRRDVFPAYDTFNEALKRRAEGLGRRRRTMG